MTLDEFNRKMKQYEYVSQHHLVRHLPVVIRIDGRAFHTFTREFGKPFDAVLMHTMDATMKYLCERISGCVLGYKQSDEISFVIIDYAHIDTEPWFNYNLEKMVSVVSSMATFIFNHTFATKVEEYDRLSKEGTISEPDHTKRMKVYQSAIDQGATFDARAFNLPREHVLDYLIWRQQDAIRNSVQAVAQTVFDPDTMYGKSVEELQQMLQKENIIWDDFAEECKYGTWCKYEPVQIAAKPDNSLSKATVRMRWEVNRRIPLFQESSGMVFNLVQI